MIWGTTHVWKSLFNPPWEEPAIIQFWMYIAKWASAVCFCLKNRGQAAIPWFVIGNVYIQTEMNPGLLHFETNTSPYCWLYISLWYDIALYPNNVVFSKYLNHIFCWFNPYFASLDLPNMVENFHFGRNPGRRSNSRWAPPRRNSSKFFKK